ncbi:MAG: AAA family ATPase [Thermodesulfobacteriota bacterium]
MRLISRIKISRFRSIKDIELKDINDFTVLAGLNNSGKSNILRALNAFFTGYTDPESWIYVDDDFYISEKKYSKKKKIRISITFTIPPNFRFRKGLENVKALFGGNEIKITKEWERLNYDPNYYINDQTEQIDTKTIEAIDQFLSMISFRYIPNRVLPLDLIKEEHAALRNALVRRFGKKEAQRKELFEAIRDSSSKLIRKMTNDFVKSFPEAEVRLKTPDSWAEMIFALGYRILENKVELDDTLQGSGIQSLLMFNTLSLIDRDYFQQFGWRQAAIWAVEEPESSLHADLEAHVASYLSEISNEKDSRLQIIATTHSDLMIQYANAIGIVTKKADGTQVELGSDKTAALQKLASTGVSRWVHPILYFPLDPVILVEGKYDYDFMNQAVKLIRPNLNIRISYLGILEAGDITGGKDEIVKYVKAHKTTIKARPKNAPLIVIFDSDAKGKKTEIEKYFVSADPIKVLIWNEEGCNPKLDKSFKGIERFFSDRIILEAEQLGAQIAWTQEGICKIAKDDIGEMKNKCNAIVNKGISYDDLNFSKKFINEVINLIQTK